MLGIILLGILGILMVIGGSIGADFADHYALFAVFRNLVILSIMGWILIGTALAVIICSIIGGMLA